MLLVDFGLGPSGGGDFVGLLLLARFLGGRSYNIRIKILFVSVFVGRESWTENIRRRLLVVHRLTGNGRRQFRRTQRLCPFQRTASPRWILWVILAPFCEFNREFNRQQFQLINNQPTYSAFLTAVYELPVVTFGPDGEQFRVGKRSRFLTHLTLFSSLNRSQDKCSNRTTNSGRYVDVPGIFAAAAESGVSDSIDEESQTKGESRLTSGNDGKVFADTQIGHED